MSGNASESGPDANRLTDLATSVPTPAAQRAERQPPVIPDHEVLRLIGRGSYGEVWLARTALGSLRAVKVVYRESFDHDRPYEREFEGIKKFEPISHARESQVDIFHVGRNNEAGFFYYIMELADAAEPLRREEDRESKMEDGRNIEPGGEARYPLSSILNPHSYAPRTLKHDLRTRGALPVAECVQIALSLTRALEHLHAHGLVHRDIKPSNIIFVNGVPKLADIGLVTSVDATRSFVGTDGYIPPEGPGTPQADLYSLGKVLYEMVTGKDRLDFPELPTDWRTRPDFEQLLEFNEILTKACDNDARQRYPSAAAMLVELETLQAGQSVKRRRAWERNWNYTKKFALAVGALAAVFAFAYSSGIWRSKPHTMKGSQNPEALREYSEGYAAMFGASGDGPARAIEHFKLAIEKDPNCAAAYVRLAQAYNQMGGPARWMAIQTAVSNALALDPQLSEAHAMLAVVKHRLELDWTGAANEMQKAIRYNPNSSETRYLCALGLAITGRREDAVKMLERAIASDPESASGVRQRHAGHVYTWSRQYDKGIEKYNEVIKNVSDSSHARIEGFLVEAYLGKGDYPKAIEHGRNAQPLPEETSDGMKARYGALKKALDDGGPQGYWEQARQFEETRSDDSHSMRLAAIYARLDRKEDALELLDEAYARTPTEFALGINTNPSFDCLRSEPEWAELMNKLWRKK